MKGISQDECRGFNKYKLNYAHVNYDNKTGFYKNTIETSAGTYEQPNTHHWKCEKCDNLFWTSKELRRYKQEYHAY
jgi:hypothetical protein